MREVKVLGGIGEINFGKQYRQGNRVYDATQISPSMMARSVGNVGGQSILFLEVKRCKRNTEQRTSHMDGLD